MSRPRIRTIKPELWHDQELQLLAAHARLLFIGLISHADDDGRLEGHVGLIRSKVFPADTDVTNKKVAAWLSALASRGFIWLYEVDSRPYIEVANWHKHQKVSHPSPSTIPGMVQE